MFSVAIPSYRHGAYVTGAVSSALASRWVREVVVVDDGSNDGSRDRIADLVRSYPGRVRELSGSGEANRGAARRLDELVAACQCEWVAVLNSDDVFAPGRFDLLRLRCTGKVTFACGHLCVIDAAGRRIGGKRGVVDPEYPFPKDMDTAALAARQDPLPLLANQNFIATTSNMVFTRTLHAAIGGFRDLRYVHDWDFALRAALHGGFLYLPHYLASYRLHGSNTIREDTNVVRQEVRGVFRALLADFPALRADAAFRTGLRGNRYLGRDWLDANGIEADGRTTE